MMMDGSKAHENTPVGVSSPVSGDCCRNLNTTIPSLRHCQQFSIPTNCGWPDNALETRAMSTVQKS